jgi:hypothetical protein
LALESPEISEERRFSILDKDQTPTSSSNNSSDEERNVTLARILEVDMPEDTELVFQKKPKSTGQHRLQRRMLGQFRNTDTVSLLLGEEPNPIVPV